MPTYAYACTACDHRFEIFQSFSDDSLTAVPGVPGPAAEGVQRRRRRVQGLRLLPHRLAQAAPRRCPRPAPLGSSARRRRLGCVQARGVQARVGELDLLRGRVGRLRLPTTGSGPRRWTHSVPPSTRLSTAPPADA